MADQMSEQEKEKMNKRLQTNKVWVPIVIILAAGVGFIVGTQVN